MNIKKMAPRRGLEPPTYRLTAECSTIELSRNIVLKEFYSFKIAYNHVLQLNIGQALDLLVSVS